MPAPCEDPDKGRVCTYGKPELWVSNMFAWELFQECSAQVNVAGMGDILGIKFEAVDFLFDLYNIIDRDERVQLFEKIMTIDRIRVFQQHKKNERAIEEQKNKARKK